LFIDPGRTPCLTCIKVIAQDPTKTCTHKTKYQSCDECRSKRVGYCQEVRWFCYSTWSVC
jgi:hypothetical protein